MTPRTFHVLGLAHQVVTDACPHCAYTMKTVNMTKMLKAAGHYVILYGAGSADLVRAPMDEYIQCVPNATLERVYGPMDPTRFNWNWHDDTLDWTEFKSNARDALRTQVKPEDVILASFGNLHALAPPSTDALTVEMGIGYYGCFADYKVWETYAWQHYMYGRYPTLVQTAAHDVVIHNYFDPTQFRYEPKPEHYALYLGRVISEKGVEFAAQVCQAAGVNLMVAGRYNENRDSEMLTRIRATGASLLGPVGQEQRRELLARARVLLCPTSYVEPFGGVATEAAYSGTPVVATDFGGFTENVIPGQTGFRIRGFHEAVQALTQIDQINRAQCNQWGQQFTLSAIWPKYEAYFNKHLELRARHGTQPHA